jgi:Fe-Mn family superoxide dismutase
MGKLYAMPRLPYGYNELEPHISAEQLRIHYEKHHQAYVNGANAILEKLDKARKEGSDLDVKSTLKSLSWNLGGHVLHSLFWENLKPKGGGIPSGMLAEAIRKEFGSFERFKKEFTEAAVSVEGSGWAALAYEMQTERLFMMQIEKHNMNLFATFPILMVLDVFEHAYYIDYKNDRARFVENFWSIVNWDAVNRRFEEANT